MAIKDIKQLAVASAKRQAPANFSIDTVDKALIGELNKYAGSLQKFMKNRYDIYEIIQEASNAVIEEQLNALVGSFADVRFVGQGEKVRFRTPLSKTRAKKFLTNAAAAGVYRTFRLDSPTFDVQTHAQGIAAILDFERILDGTEVYADAMAAISEGLSETVYNEVLRALESLVDVNLPAANKAIDSNFSAANLAKIANIVRTYSDDNKAIILASPEFIAEMGADAIVAPAQNVGGVYSPEDISDIRNLGHVTMFRGNIVVPLRQEYLDFDNKEAKVDPSIAYVLPSSKDKVVKVVIEGGTQIADYQNRDWSMEIQAYHKVGAAIVSTNAIGVYQNSSLKA